MDKSNEPQDNSLNKEPIQPQEPEKWHPPQLQRLRLSLDTAFGGGSNIDGFTGSLPPQ
ncbi:MAG: hypothetical protein QNJ45_01420 [Ardenticatenaceae bacterium]|nr:hypothetical protein [Ardenticatenaceae bacterium]